MAQMKTFSANHGKILAEVVGGVAESKISAADKQKLSQLVGMQLGDDFYFLKKNVCKSCNKELSFYDVVKTSMDKGIHDKQFFQNLLGGNQLIVRNGAEDKEITCSQCSTITMLDGGYTCVLYAMF